MEENQSILQQFNDLHILDSLYDTIRMLDPMQKRVEYLLKPDWLKGQNQYESCYCFWEKSTACENCASVRAFNQNKAVVKIEFKQERVFMVMSAPLVFQGRKVVIELLKDITDNGIIDIEGKVVNEIQKMINQKNRLIIRDALSRIYNEEFVYERLPYNIHLANQENKRLTLIYLSVTNLIAIIETVGLKAGDEVIKKLAKSLRSFCLDGEDWVARYGSASFILCLAGLEESQAGQICQRIREKAGKLDFKFPAGLVEAEITVGSHTMWDENIPAIDFIQAARRNAEESKDAAGPANGEDFFDNYRLTGREKEIAVLVFNGLATKDIADHLFISSPTVKKHISAVFAKAGVKSRAELFAKYQQGML